MYTKVKYTTPAGTWPGLYSDILKQNHTLIAGTTGSGKSTVIHGIIYAILHRFPTDYQMALIDLKRVELARYKKMPHTQLYASDIPEALHVLDKVIKFMEDRYHWMEQNEKTQHDGAHLYVIIDEFADLIDSDKSVADKIKKIGRLGRAANIHLILATQSPSREVIPASIQLNITCKVCLRCLNPIESRQVIGIPGAEKLPLFGIAYYMAPQYYEPGRCEVEKIDDEEIKKIIEHWKGPGVELLP